MDKFSETLVNLDWSTIDLLDDVNLAWDMIYKGILIEVNKLCPYKEFKVRSNRPAWFNTTLINWGYDRDILHRNYRRSGSSNKDIYNRLTEKRKEFNREVKNAKRTFNTERISQYQGDTKNFWKLIDSLIGGQSCKAIDRVYSPGTNVLCREDETANVVNRFFAQVGDKIGEEIKLNVLNRNFVQLSDKISNEYGMAKILPINNVILFDILKELDCNKSSGVTDISSNFIFDAIAAMPDVFIKLINLSLSTGVFPNAWKCAKITVTPKKGDLK